MRRLPLALCLVASGALAQEGRATDDQAAASAPSNTSDGDDERPTPSEPSERQIKLNDGRYGGVAPGAQNLPPRSPHLPLKGPQRLTWSGFQVKDGVPTVFLEVTGSPDYSVAERPGELVVTLKNTVVPIKNNRRPLRVEAFGTAVKSVETATKGKETRVLIHTKDAVSHKLHVEPAHGGFQLLLIELSPRP